MLSDFVNAFRPHTLRAWTMPIIVEWKSLLVQRGIHHDINRERQQIQTIIDILYQREHRQAVDQEENQTVEKGNREEKGRVTEENRRTEKPGVEGNRSEKHLGQQTPTTLPTQVDDN